MHRTHGCICIEMHVQQEAVEVCMQYLDTQVSLPSHFLEPCILLSLLNPDSEYILRNPQLLKPNPEP
jgi:hypothetical protein